MLIKIQGNRGYVGVPQSHPLWGKVWHQRVVVDRVDMNLSFSGNAPPDDVPDGHWWFGFVSADESETQADAERLAERLEEMT